MMWNWLISSLAVGVKVVLYDGAPLAPSPGMLWDMVDQEGITVFGTSAKYLALLEKSGAEPRKSHDLSKLKTILSTGSPLADHSFDYVYRKIKTDVHLASISGGSDIISCFVLGNPIMPVYRGEIQTPGLGMAVDVLDDRGRPVRLIPGELVCTRPFPSMPVAFWDDPDGEKYRAAYFEYFSDVWRHGDWAEITRNRGYIIYGRSDATLNPGGVRIGTAEIYRQVDQMPEVLESVAVGQEIEGGSPGDVRIVLFVRPSPRPDAGRRPSRPHRHATARQYHAAPRAEEDHSGGRHPAHDQRKDQRAGRSRSHSRASGQEHRGPGESAIALVIREDAAAPRLAKLAVDHNMIAECSAGRGAVSAGRLPARAWLRRQDRRPCPEASDRGQALERQASARCDSARRRSSRPTCAQR